MQSKNLYPDITNTLDVPTITVSEDDKKYIEKLRKKIPFDKVPFVKRTIELVLRFIEERESDFLKWVGEREGQES